VFVVMVSLSVVRFVMMEVIMVSLISVILCVLVQHQAVVVMVL